MVPARAHVAILLIALSARVLAASEDVPLSPALKAPLTGIHAVSIATSGTEYMIVFNRPGALLWQRVALDGAPIDPEAKELARVGLVPAHVIWTGETYLALWAEGADLIGRAIERDGTAGPRAILLAGVLPRGVWSLDALQAVGESAVLLSANGLDKVVAWLDSRGGVIRTASLPGRESRLVRLDEGWRLLGPDLQYRDLILADPDSGATRVVAQGFTLRETFPSPGGGAIALAVDGRIGALTSSGDFVELSLDHPIERLSDSRPVLIAPTPAGWAVIYRSAGAARIASVRGDATVAGDRLLAGAFPSPGAYQYTWIASAAPDEENHLLVQAAAIGIESLRISHGAAAVTGIYAIGEAAQRWARVAPGPGIDLVVWLEAGDWAWTIRATRVRDGLPLDGAGLVLASGYPYYPLHAAFDGDHFAVVWMDRDGTSMRRVAIDGAIVDSTPVLLHADASLGAIAAAGDGTLLIAWSMPPMVTIVRDGTPLPALPLQGDPVAFNVVTAAGGPASFLVASIGLLPGCRVTCSEMPMAVEARVLTRDGVPLGPVIEAAITDSHNFGLDAPLFLRGAWLLPVQVREGRRLVRMTEMGSPLARVPILGGDLRPTPMGIELWGYAASHPFRGLLSPEGENVRYEPLPIGAEESAAATLGSATLLLERAERYILRQLGPAAHSADLALVHRRRAVTATSVVDEVTIEHRGGDPVSAIYVDAWPRFNSGIEIASSRPIAFGRIEGPFSPGEAIDLVIRGWKNQSEDRLIVALPAAREIAAANNFLEISDPPPRPRQRTVRR